MGDPPFAIIGKGSPSASVPFCTCTRAQREDVSPSNIWTRLRKMAGLGGPRRRRTVTWPREERGDDRYRPRNRYPTRRRGGPPLPAHTPPSLHILLHAPAP